jgi:signal peptidase
MSTRKRMRWALLGVAVALLAALGVTAASFFSSHHLYVIHTGSMLPGYQLGDVVVDRPGDGHYAPGQVITFRHAEDSGDDLVTHRIVSVRADGGIITKGDANQTADPWMVAPADVVGVAQTHVAKLGYVIVYLRQAGGIASLATSVLAVVLLWHLFFPGTADAPTRRRMASHRLRPIG